MNNIARLSGAHAFLQESGRRRASNANGRHLATVCLFLRPRRPKKKPGTYFESVQKGKGTVNTDPTRHRREGARPFDDQPGLSASSTDGRALNCRRERAPRAPFHLLQGDQEGPTRQSGGSHRTKNEETGQSVSQKRLST